MKPVKWWKNFNLGTELDVSGCFIYNGLNALDELQTIHYESDVFEILYNLSVGIERLEKIVITLIEHDESMDQQEFEKSLITHNHLDLLFRIRKKHNFRLSTVHNKFLQILDNFYRVMRYDRFSLMSIYDFGKEVKALLNFLVNELNIGDKNGTQPESVSNSTKIKKFIGNIVGKISSELYQVVCDESDRLNIYTYEIRYGSKAFKIFIAKKFDFYKEKILRNELLVFLCNSEQYQGFRDFLKGISPLDFDKALANDYIKAFHNKLECQEFTDELDSLYEDIKHKKNRLEMIEVLGMHRVMFDYSDHEEDDIQE